MEASYVLIIGLLVCMWLLLSLYLTLFTRAWIRSCGSNSVYYSERYVRLALVAVTSVALTIVTVVLVEDIALLLSR